MDKEKEAYITEGFETIQEDADESSLSELFERLRSEAMVLGLFLNQTGTTQVNKLQNLNESEQLRLWLHLETIKILQNTLTYKLKTINEPK